MKRILIFLLCLQAATNLFAQISTTDPIQIGAEIIIEPGQNDRDVESWFKTLRDNHMQLTRIRMFENYMKDDSGNWDFTLFDKAFRYAEKYHIKVYANLFPATDFTDLGGFKYPHSEEHLAEIANYIKNVVRHFDRYKSLYGWVPINEPGGGNTNNEFSKKLYSEWLLTEHKKTTKAGNLSDYRKFDFNSNKFLMYYNTWYLRWLSEEIRKYDSRRPIHVNNHQIFSNVAEYDFPQWRRFLSSLGGSAHPSWHFNFFDRQRYAVAMSANSEIIRSGAGKLPWLMTEIQGGNNIYSGNKALCPTVEEIVQWFWITLGSGSKGAIFWSLNPRASGFEAGEWAMVDFKNQPTERLVEVGRIAKVIENNQSLFKNASPVNSRIHILYTRESFWIEKKMAVYNEYEQNDFRNQGGVMKSALAFFEALTYMGLQPSIGEFEEFDFTKKDFTGETIILSNQVSIPKKYDGLLRRFVNAGGTLFMEGLTAFYDENAVCRMMNDFMLKDLLGGCVSEYTYADNVFNITLDEQIQMPVHALWGKLETLSGNDSITKKVLINHFGKGRTIWVPSLIGLGARASDDYLPLICFLQKYLDVQTAPFRYRSPQKGMLMKVLKTDDGYVGILINKTGEKKRLLLEIPITLKQNKILYSFKKASAVSPEELIIDSEDVVVIKWTH